MTSNPKRGSLPYDVAELNPGFREQIIDQNLGRPHVINRIVDELADDGIDLSDMADREELTISALASWYRQATESTLTTSALVANHSKGDLIQEVAALYDVDIAEDGRQVFKKKHLVQLYVALVTGATPEDVNTLGTQTTDSQKTVVGADR